MHKAIISLSDIKNLDTNDATICQNLINIFNQAPGFELVHIKRKHKDKLCIHYNAAVVSLANIKAILAAGGYQLDSKYHTLNLKITNLDCHDCIKVIEHEMNRLPGMIAVYGSYTTGAFRIEYNSDLVAIQDIENNLIKLEYDFEFQYCSSDDYSSHIVKAPVKCGTSDMGNINHSNDDHQHVHQTDEPGNLLHIGCAGHKHVHQHTSIFGKYKEIILSITTGILWVGGILAGYLDHSKTAMVLWLMAYLPGGITTLHDSIRALLQRRFNIESLMILAAIGAGCLGKLNEGALLLFLFSLGHALEHFALEKAKKSIKTLTDMSPKKALVKLANGQISEIMVDQLLLNQVVIVKSGQMIPCDGVIIAGMSSIDQSAITGESMPISKNINDKVFAGTMNGDGVLEINVTKLSRETMLSRMIRLITEADTQKSKTQRFAEKFEQIFVPIVLLFVGVIAVLPPLLGLMSIKQSIFMAIVILVSASPCALALATPVAVLVGISRAARDGILIKGGAALENLGQVKAIAFDKTGTLTVGKPAVTDVLSFNDCSISEIMAYAYGLELGSSHPLAQAVINYCKTNNIVPKLITNIKSFPGMGIVGEYESIPIQLGNPKMFTQYELMRGDVETKFENVTSNANLDQTTLELQSLNLKVLELEKSGLTTILLRVGEVFVGVIAIADQLRLGVSDTIRDLKQQGVIHNVMLTGDNEIVANAIARDANVDQVYASLLPEDKLNKIKELTTTYGYTAMVGDGVNDAPAMANATVGIAMGGTKMDVAIETSNVVLMNDNLNKLSLAFKISQKTRSIIKQNLFISLGVIGVLVSGGLFSITDIGVAVFIHEGSSLLVIFNALRIFKIRQ